MGNYAIVLLEYNMLIHELETIIPWLAAKMPELISGVLDIENVNVIVWSNGRGTGFLPKVTVWTDVPMTRHCPNRSEIVNKIREALSIDGPDNFSYKISYQITDFSVNFVTDAVRY